MKIKELDELIKLAKQLKEELKHYKDEVMRLITTNNTSYSYGIRGSISDE